MASYTNTQFIVGGLVALVILRNLDKLFSGIGRGLGVSGKVADAEDKAEEAEISLAAKFDQPSQTPELWAAHGFTDGAAAGTISPAEVDALLPLAPRIGAAAQMFYMAKGTFMDSEDEAIAAVGAMDSTPMLLAMGEAFFGLYGTTLGAYGQTFLSRADKAAIVSLVLKLRK